MLGKFRERDVFYVPIAGTSGGGKDEAEDQLLEPRNCGPVEKEPARHIILFRSGTQRSSRVCDYGHVSPKIAHRRALLALSMHLVFQPARPPPPREDGDCCSTR